MGGACCGGFHGGPTLQPDRTRAEGPLFSPSEALSVKRGQTTRPPGHVPGQQALSEVPGAQTMREAHRFTVRMEYGWCEDEEVWQQLSDHPALILKIQGVSVSVKSPTS